jgi:hypothetical protein
VRKAKRRMSVQGGVHSILRNLMRRSQKRDT